MKWAEAWRPTGDIWDTWETPGPWQNSVSEIGFNQDAWTAHGGPGGWNDPDMLVVGRVGWGPQLTYLYNDAYQSIIGGKHPQALGQPTVSVWREIQAEISPLLESAMSGDGQ